MTRIERNGVSGLLLRSVVIVLATVMFGCAPTTPAGQADVSGAVSAAGRWTDPS